jgi:hypothetical protein
VSVEGAAIREALRGVLLHRPELDRDPDSFADLTMSGRCEPGCEGCAALAALDTLAETAAIARDLAKKVEDGSADPIDISTLYCLCVVLAEELECSR